MSNKEERMNRNKSIIEEKWKADFRNREGI